MVEYSVITHAILIGGATLLLPVVSRLFDALSLYLESIFFVLTTAAI